jgi:threonine dehydrogenase-like Zn-dependent dehydrogenase
MLDVRADEARVHALGTNRTEGAGVHVAIECAGKEAALNAAGDAVRPQGTVVQTGLPPGRH